MHESRVVLLTERNLIIGREQVTVWSIFLQPALQGGQSRIQESLLPRFILTTTLCSVGSLREGDWTTMAPYELQVGVWTGGISPVAMGPFGVW